MHRNLTAADRRAHWEETYVSSNDWDFGQWIAEFVRHGGEYLEQLIGADLVAEPLRAMLANAANSAGVSDAAAERMTWRELLEGSASAWDAWAFGRVLQELVFYGRYGIVADEKISLEDRQDHIQRLLEQAEAVLRVTPLRAIAERENNPHYGAEVEKVMLMARNRWALDEGEGVIDPTALALFGGVTEGRIRNLMSGANRELENVNGKVTVSSALRWLADRPDFFNSIWQDEESSPPSAAETPYAAVRFLPKARDGSFFHPGLKRADSYTVGAKGSEVHIADFDEALDYLQRLPSAMWRRPNEAGNWGIVKAADWVRVTDEELQSIAGTA